MNKLLLNNNFVQTDTMNQKEINTFYTDFFNVLMGKFLTIYQNQFTFSTTDKWTQQHIDVLFHSLFYFGNVAVKKIQSGTEFEYVIYTLNIPKYDWIGNIKSGKAILTARLMPYDKNDYYNKFYVKLDGKDAVFGQAYVLNRTSPYLKIFSLVQHIAKLATNIKVGNQYVIPKLLLKMTDGKKSDKHLEEYKNLIANISNIIMPVSKVVKAEGEDSDKKISLFGADQLKDYFFSLLKIISPDQLKALTEQVNENINLVYRVLGIRQNVSFKKERQFSSEIELNSIEYKPAEMEFRKQLEKFIDSFNKQFNENIEIIDNLPENDKPLDANNEGIDNFPTINEKEMTNE